MSYPEEVQEMINKVASQSMVGDMNRYQQMAVLDSMTAGNAQGGQMAADMASMQMGMMMGQQIVNQMTQTQQGGGAQNVSGPNFCPNCGQKAGGANFCPNCGQKLK